jgi:hypothetical protein
MTNIVKLGVPYPSQSSTVQEKIVQASLLKFGTRRPTQNDKIKEKVRNTVRTNFGVDNPTQHPAILEKAIKSAHKYKEYTIESGKVYTYQGYENFALDDLFKKMKYDECEVEMEHIYKPEVWYNDPNNGIKRRYHPDIFLPLENKIIEVKSVWTYKSDIEKNLAKEQRCKELGYQFDFWIYDEKGNRIDSDDIEF